MAKAPRTATWPMFVRVGNIECQIGTITIDLDATDRGGVPAADFDVNPDSVRLARDVIAATVDGT